MERFITEIVSVPCDIIMLKGDIKMSTKTLTMPESALISLLKSLPKKTLVDIFWKSVVECDISPLTDEEKKDRINAHAELKKGATFKWKDLR